MQPGLVLATVGDRLAYDVVTSMLAADAEVGQIAARLFELAADHDGVVLDGLVAIAAEATSDAHPAWAQEAFSACLGGASFAGTSVSTIVWEASPQAARPMTITTPLAFSVG